MTINKLITYGCSNTYGQSLTNRESEAWPYVIGNLLELPVDNRGCPGSSNDRILRILVTTDVEILKNSLVIIMWSYTERYEMIYNEDLVNIGNWSTRHNNNEGELARNFYKYVYSDTHGKYNSAKTIHHAQCFLQSHNIDYRMMFVKPDTLVHHYHDLIDYSKWYALTDDSLFHFKNRYPLAPDKMHAGAEAHADFANTMYNSLFKTD